MTIDVAISDSLQAELSLLRQRVAELEQSLQTNAEETAGLRGELAYFNSAFDATPLGVALVDLDGRFMRVNQALCNLVGRSIEDMLALRFRDITHPDDLDADVSALRAMRAGEIRSYQREKRYLHADGHVVWVLLSVTLVGGESGQPTCFFSLFEDITERRQTELALQESEQRFLQFIDVLPVGVFVLEGDGTPFYANQAAQHILGKGIIPQAAPGALAQVYQAYIADSDTPYPMARMPVVRALSGERSTIDDMEIHQPDRVIPLEVTAAPILDASGAVSYAIAIFTDITERRQAEQALRQSISQEEIIRAQSANLQELSTPLIPINDQVLAMPLVGSIDSRRAQLVIESLLRGVSEQRAHVVILDITGVQVVDTQVANALVRAAQSVQLLGAQVVLTGIRPEVAQTLVGLGVDLRSIVTRATLQSGIAYAVQGRS